MASGTIKWFHTIIGCGVISPDDGTASVLVRATPDQSACLGHLKKGDRLEYDMVRALGGQSLAVNLRATADALPEQSR